MHVTRYKERALDVVQSPSIKHSDFLPGAASYCLQIYRAGHVSSEMYLYRDRNELLCRNNEQMDFLRFVSCNGSDLIGKRGGFLCVKNITSDSFHTYMNFYLII